MFSFRVPGVVFTDQSDGSCTWSPFSVPNTLFSFVFTTVEAVEFISLGEVFHAAFVGVDCVTDGFEDVPSVFEVVSMRPEGGIPFEAIGSIVIGDGADEAVLFNECLAFGDDCGG